MCPAAVHEAEVRGFKDAHQSSAAFARSLAADTPPCSCSASDGCAGSKTSISAVKMVVAVITFGAAVVSSFMSFRLSERVQEEMHEKMVDKSFKRD